MSAAATSEFAKCRCQHCNGQIEFSPDEAGQMATCPLCGLETLLYIPQKPKRPERKPFPWRAALRYAGIGIAIVLLGWFIGLLTVRVVTALANNADVVGSVLSGIFGMVVLFVAVIWAALWVLFPVFMYFGIRRMNRTLEQIERNTRS